MTSEQLGYIVRLGEIEDRREEIRTTWHEIHGKRGAPVMRASLQSEWTGLWAEQSAVTRLLCQTLEVSPAP